MNNPKKSGAQKPPGLRAKNSAAKRERLDLKSRQAEADFFRRTAAEHSQARSWGRHAGDYEELFVQPFDREVSNPLPTALNRLRSRKKKHVADIGCGKGDLTVILAEMFGRVTAIDFSRRMLAAARVKLAAAGLDDNVEFVRAGMTDLSEFYGRFDVITATSSIVMPDPLDREKAFSEIFMALKPGGLLLGIVPSFDAVCYHAGLLYHAARKKELAPQDAREYAMCEIEAGIFDFTLGIFDWDGIRQKFYHPFEIEDHLRIAGFREIRLEKVEYPWGYAADPVDVFPDAAPLWDWFFRARRPRRRKSAR